MNRKPRYWLSRLVISTWALHLPLVAWLEPESIAARVLTAGGPMGAIALLVLAGLALIALADVAFNDFPVGNWFGVGLEHRHIGFMLMAIVLVLLGGVILKAMGPSPILLAYVLPAFFSLVLVPLDMVARHGSRQQ